MDIFGMLPAGDRERYAEERLEPGSVVRVWCPWIQKANRYKFLLVGPIEPDFMSLMINTDERRSAPVQTQVQILPANYDAGAFTGTCHVDCNTAVTQLTYNDVKTQIVNRIDCFRCKMTRDDLDSVVAALKFATDLTGYQQDAFLAAFEAA
jgi:hypothetical protein